MSNNNTDAFNKHTIPVSVVVPCYRCSGTIGRAVASVDAQTYRPQEVLLIDDASSDDTLNKLHELQQQYGVDWIKIIALPVNVGTSSARNVGWNSAAGGYIAFLDADDAWHPRKIEIQYGFMNTHPDYVLTGHGHRWVAEIPTQHSSVGRVRHKIVSYQIVLSHPL
jgi:teichuronic acid biosynthesis glycosyltransferase TuaG